MTATVVPLHLFAHKQFIDQPAYDPTAFNPNVVPKSPFSADLISTANAAGNAMPSGAPPSSSSALAATLPSARLSSLSFSLLTSADTLRMSALPVVNRTLYDPSTMDPTEYGCLDPRLGTSTKSRSCTTCKKQIADCIGHFGHIDFHLPVFHIGYFKEVIRILQSICKSCSRILLNHEEIAHYSRLMKARDRLARTAIHDKIILPLVKKKRECPHCGAPQGIIKKLTSAFRIVHELKHKNAEEERLYYLSTFHNATKFNPQIKEFLSKALNDFNPLLTFSLFQNIKPSDLPLLNFDSQLTHPVDTILCRLPVPPASVRPSVSVGVTGSNEDDLTVKIGDIIFINDNLRKSLKKGVAVSNVQENWDFLQQQVAMYVNSDLPGFPKTVISKPIRALIQRLKGKQGRFRGNLSGKRVDFSSRTVISPDPNLRIDEVGLPVHVAKVLTFPEKAHAHNIGRLRAMICNGPDEWPGANIVEYANGMKIFLRYGNRQAVAAKLKFGDTVERHIIHGDMVLFNRQPSLHRMSIMCHFARILPHRTFRFNECVCSPYNADFDGDEMNVHVPQTEEARTEARLLMGVKENLITPRHGEPLVTATQDFITSAYLITQRDVFFDRCQFVQLCCAFTDANFPLRLPEPAIHKPIRLWTGKQLMSILINPAADMEFGRRVNVELKERNYTSNLYMCARDGFVVVRRGELLCGNWAKSTVGGDKNGLLYHLIREHGSPVAAAFLNRLAKLSARYIGNRGFSIGIDDVTPSSKLITTKESMLETGYNSCYDKIKLYEQGKLPPASGCNEEETLESMLLGELSQIREDLGSQCLKELNILHNSPLIMAVCGSKGSKINISQMVACVGQQAISGHRIADGFLHRTLPHFKFFSKDPDAKGFVRNSFYSGLTATEFFMHTCGGREGLVDTAVKTAETGYMQRRLMKALEDLCVQYDGTVRTSEHNVVQFVYGDDGLDPLTMANGSIPVHFGKLFESIRISEADHSKHPSNKSMSSSEIKKMSTVLDTAAWKVCSSVFIDRLKEFIRGLCDELDAVWKEFNFDPNVPAPLYSSNVSVEWHVIHQAHKVTPKQFKAFLNTCLESYKRAVIEAGTAVGAIGAQSIGEPGTQMTLKTFHFAGVASMNVTLGVPRIKEIINAAKKISTPIITAPILSDRDVKAARIVQARIQKTTLGEIAEYIEEIYTSQECYIQIKLDMDAIEALALAVDSNTVTRSIIEAKKLKIKNASAVRPKSLDVLRVYPAQSLSTDEADQPLMFTMQRLKNALPSVVIRGVPLVNRAVINDKGDGSYHLLVEGYNLLGVMGTEGVDGAKCTSNHVEDMLGVLGIEAARGTIMKEILGTMEGHGLTLDSRHVSVLADVMCYRGRVLGITRFGVAQMKESVLMLASFEKTADHLFEAALRGAHDDVKGVSECIIMGQPIPVGTGLFSLMHRADHSHSPQTFRTAHANNNNNNNAKTTSVRSRPASAAFMSASSVSTWSKSRLLLHANPATGKLSL